MQFGWFISPDIGPSHSLRLANLPAWFTCCSFRALVLLPLSPPPPPLAFSPCTRRPFLYFILLFFNLSQVARQFDPVCSVSSDTGQMKSTRVTHGPMKQWSTLRATSYEDVCCSSFLPPPLDTDVISGQADWSVNQIEQLLQNTMTWLPLTQALNEAMARIEGP